MKDIYINSFYAKTGRLPNEQELAKYILLDIID